jgi:hypothetical protein
MLYENKYLQDLFKFDRIAQNLDKFARPVSQDKYENYNNGELYDIGDISALNNGLRINKE